MAASMDLASLNIPADELYRSRRPETLASIILFAILMVTAVVLRVIARRMQKAGWQLDDWAIALAVLPTTGCFVLSVLMSNLGSGRHIPKVPLENHERLFLYLYIYQFFYATSILLIKISLLSFFTRIFDTPRFRLIARLVAAVVVVWYLVAIFLAIFICTPVSGFWTQHNPISPPAQPRCIDIRLFYVGKAIPNMLTDILILALPIRSVWHLHMTRAQKVSITFIFFLGGFTVLASVLRLREQFRVDDKDFTWALNGTVVWSFLEPSCGIICACLPTVRIVFRMRPWSADANAYDYNHYANDRKPSNAASERKYSTGPLVKRSTIDVLNESAGTAVFITKISRSSKQRKISDAESMDIIVEQTIDVHMWDEERGVQIPSRADSWSDDEKADSLFARDAHELEDTSITKKIGEI